MLRLPCAPTVYEEIQIEPGADFCWVWGVRTVRTYLGCIRPIGCTRSVSRRRASHGWGGCQNASGPGTSSAKPGVLDPGEVCSCDVNSGAARVPEMRVDVQVPEGVYAAAPFDVASLHSGSAGARFVQVRTPRASEGSVID